jgi:hypothetical protein
MVAWLIIDHEMWERPDDEVQRDLTALFNGATALTLLIGVIFLFVGLLVIGFVADLVLIDTAVLTAKTGGRATLGDHLRVVWLGATIATVAGAVGTGFESDEAVRQAAYGYRQHERLERDAERKRDEEQ